MDKEVIVAIECDASLLVRMARTFEQGASLEDITEFVRDWTTRKSRTPCACPQEHLLVERNLLSANLQG